ncbi:hypothetical protein COCVIDRAFT_40399 [Bipolaris victoriae FI3]|uniref:Fe2OG dioxygenase domain-containing protein n=2 Tax=Bipolaris TaxID=33194 RepID=W6YS96_COCC2|nr:uncharacterized protein COCCADRAFT_35951 [Bipolaris zeicola 26-R-13]XP_014553646.1 hypothetical protein COCVIDRAFT_40399 [Bipolaris victoriae FI3]EUC34386.1 hypothetical protein COCCADRAFT_35951 [Bipolaris zeicola 26-R-13]
MVNMNLRTLDFTKFTGTDQERKEFCQAFLDGITEVGFVKLMNHGLDDKTNSELFQQSRNLFTLPREGKEEFANVIGPKPQRGWSCIGAETTATLNTPGVINMVRVNNEASLQEHFDMGPVDDPEFPNVYPSEEKAPGFKNWMEQYFIKSQHLSLQLMEALEIALDLPKSALVDRCEGHASEIRMIYYPETNVKELADGKSKRIWPHTDFGILTLLAQGSTGGLQIEDKNNPGGYVSVPLVEKTELLINVGDTLERWSNGRIPAGLHQVAASGETEDGTLPERYSVAFFLKANRKTSAGPIPIFVPKGTTSKYEEMTALEYHRRRTAIMY